MGGEIVDCAVGCEDPAGVNGLVICWISMIELDYDLPVFVAAEAGAVIDVHLKVIVSKAHSRQESATLTLMRYS